MTEMDYSKTVLLPKTKFPMRADLPKREPEILKFWEKMDLYGKMLLARKGKPPYILHDGPPYANGHIHIGHALNKILKDMTVKSAAMSGRFAPYVPGWDCHGLPIEQALLKEMKIGKRHVEDIVSFRKKAREFAGKFINIQREEFKRLGVTGEWDNPYITMSTRYEGSIIHAFMELFRKGYIHKDKKTVYWCASCETALADAEVEYKDKVSPAVYVKFKTAESAGKLSGLPIPASAGVFIVIWTTTPWTLPANMASAVAKDENYSVFKNKKDGEFLIIADKLADGFMSETGLDCEKIGSVSGEKLVGLKYKPPFSDRINPVIETDFVAMDAGTGIVHIAPGHGEDDFYAGKKWGIEIFCPVDNCGKFTKEAGDFAGLQVFEANPVIIEKLRGQNALIAHKDITHSYPHCWRCKQPVIFRATEQWFMSIDKNGLRNELIRAAERVRWIPPAGRDRISAMLELRPDWCLSRQRYWGTPIPVLYCKTCDKPQADDRVLKLIEKRVFAEGTDFWFAEEPSKLVPEGYKCSCGGAEFIKEKDILDVWMDSGVSWLAVLKGREAENNGDMKWYPADLYLEGSDQHRGWFQTSLIPSVAIEGGPPYHAVLTHGFVLDDNGRAMHKSMGNVVSPQEVIDKCGADVLRLWTALSDYSEDVRLSPKLLEGPVDSYRKIRNTLRYLLGNIWDYKPQEHIVEYAKLEEMDRYMLHLLSELIKSVRDNYKAFRFRAAIRAIADFCILDLSAFYLDALKDRLYTLGKNSPERRSCQTVLHEITVSLLKLMAPVLSFTAEEAWQLLREDRPDSPESVFLSDFPAERGEWRDENLCARWSRIRQIREKILKSLEESRQNGNIGASLEAAVTFRTSDSEMHGFISGAMKLWPSIAIISDCRLELYSNDAHKTGGWDKAVENLQVLTAHAEGTKCPRCWQWKKDIGACGEHPKLCLRCAEVLKKDA